MKAKWWIIGGLILAGAGVGAYFLFRKPKDEDDLDKLTENGSSTSSGGSNTSSSIKCEGNFPSTPFSSNTEGNAFRLWVNTNFPAYAKEIDLDKTGEFNNCFIKKAYDKYGKAYSFALVSTYLGNKAKLSSDKNKYTVLPSQYIGVNFFSNGRYFIVLRSNEQEIQRGSYKLGGRIMKSDTGESVSSSNVLQNVATIVKPMLPSWAS